MMDHNDRPPEQVEAIHTGEDMGIDQEKIIASKVSVDKGSATARASKLAARLLAQRFGEIPGVPVGAKWESRKDCSSASVHRPLMAGIHGTKETGALSIVVSCYYKDDKDFGDTIYYTGTGGRKRWSDGCPPKRLRLGPQIFDQQWSDSGNEALVKSRDTGNPVRVIRSHKVLSDFAPAEGYRYDGLYTVESAWKEKNPKGLDICRYRLERVPGQPPLLRRSLGDTDHEPSPASVATSDTVISPSRTFISRKRKTRPFAHKGDPTIYADAVSKKRKLPDRASPLPLPSSSPSIVQPQVSAPVLVTIETPLQKHNKRVQKEMQKEKQQRSLGRSSPAKIPAKIPSLRTLTTPNTWSSQSQPNGSLVWPSRSISYDEDDEDADMLIYDEDEEDMLLEDLEITASSFSSFLSPSPF
ncbi:PUA-like domain-containing protein [Suillus occidentalis]|nr:PUA-like domain-containing protein [Suillus occidentalis]